MVSAIRQCTVRASARRNHIASPMALCWLTAATMVLAPVPGNGEESSVSQESARLNTSVFDCPGTGTHEPFEFTIRRGPGELALWLPLSFGLPYVVLSRDFDADGEMYREGDVSLRLSATSASLNVDSDDFSDCVVNPLRSVWEHAKLSGIDYRASGTDPDWYLEIRRGGSLVFASGRSNTRVDMPAPEPEYDALRERTLYRSQTDQGSFIVEIGSTSCVPEDGAPITGSSVLVSLETQTFSGCGRALH